MIAAIVGGVLAIGIAILAAAKAAVGLYVYFGIAWVIWAFLALGIENKRDQSRLAKLGDWLPLPYDWIMERVLKGLPRLLLPKTIEQQPKPETGFLAKFEWHMAPRAKTAPI